MRIFSVSEYRQELNDLLAQVTVVIEGEVRSMNVSQGRFIWFTLSDQETSIDCFMMTFEMRVQMAEGMRVRVTGSPNMFKKGKVVFRPRTLEIVGDGDLQKAFEILKGKLEKEGLFDEARKRSLAKIPQRIGIVTSRDAAAYTDILRVLQNRWPGVEVVLAHVQVQGEAAPGSIVSGLFQMYEHASRVALDCIVVTRGGGSAEDLQAFNTEEVVRAAYASPVPLVSAIGHERDTTLVDFVADVRAATPSNAAELIAPNRDDIESTVEYWVTQMKHHVSRRLHEQQQRASNAVGQLGRHAEEPIRVYASLEQRLLFCRERIIGSHRAMTARVESWASMLQQLHPQRILEKGFTITRDQDGNLLRSSSTAKTTTSLHTQFADGEVVSIPKHSDS